MKRLSIILVGILALSTVLVGCGSKTNVSPTSTNVSNTQQNINGTNGSQTQNMSSTNSQTNNSETKVFSPEDAKVLGIKIDMTNNEVEKVLGKPKKVEEKSIYGAEGGLHVYYYDFGTVSLEFLKDNIYTVSFINIEKPGFEGPRGIKVGEDIDNVMKKFPYTNLGDIERQGEEYTIRYLYGKGKENRGILEYNKEGKLTTLIYNYGLGFGGHGLIFDIENGKVKSINMSVKNN